MGHSMGHTKAPILSTLQVQEIHFSQAGGIRYLHDFSVEAENLSAIAHSTFLAAFFGLNHGDSI